MLRHLHSTIFLPGERVLLSRRISETGSPYRWNATTTRLLGPDDNVAMSAKLCTRHDFGIGKELFDSDNAKEGFYGTIEIDDKTDRQVIIHTVKVLSMLKFATKPDNAFRIISVADLIRHVNNDTPESKDYTEILKAVVKQFEPRGVV